jgi:hypothetical protein
MSFEKAVAVIGPDSFKQRLANRVSTLALERLEAEFAFAVAFFFVIDERNGADDTAKELVRRFALLDSESGNVLDFYFLGWRQSADPSKGLEFDLAAFEGFRDAFRRNGIKEFGGNADLILCDAWYRKPRVFLDFTCSLHINLSDAVKKGKIDKLGSFLETLIDATNDLRSVKSGDSITFRISDKLGLAVARQSILEFLLEKWGKLIGAKKLEILATRNIGPRVDLAAL